MPSCADESCGGWLRLALRRLSEDGLVAFPTETVWGLGARAEAEGAVARLRAWKGRRADKPLSVMVGGLESLERLEVDLRPDVRRLIAAFWPGPLTLILPCGRRFAPGVARSDGAVGVRCSSHPMARELAEAVENRGLGLITATSLNRSGEPPARSWAEARRLCQGEGVQEPRDRAVWIPDLSQAPQIDAMRAPPSTVLDATGTAVRVLRWGAITSDRLAPLLGGL